MTREVTHILISNTPTRDINPYYTPNNRDIESELIETIKTTVHHFYNVDEVRKYIADNPNILNQKYSAFYEVKKITPKYEVVISV